MKTSTPANITIGERLSARFTGTLKKAVFTTSALLLSTGFLTAQALDAEVEGPVSAIVKNADSSVTMTIMGSTVRVPVGTPVNSPTAALTVDQLVDPTPLPNRGPIEATATTPAVPGFPGFIGGTAIVTGTVGADGIVTAADVFVEPAENVLLGLVTVNNPGSGTTPAEFRINNIPIVLLPASELRMPSKPVQDVNGIAIFQDSIAVGTGASAEGYFANGVFNAFLVEAEVGTPLVSAPQLTIVRATARERNANRGDEVEVRGSVTTTHVAAGVTTQTVRVSRIDGTRVTPLGDALATLDPLIPGVAEWRLRVITPVTTDPVLSTAPTTVRAVNISAGANNASATAPVEVR